VQITDRTHLVMRVKGSTKWGIPLHIAQVPDWMMTQLKDQGYVLGTNFVYSEE
jgi:hypothetical protein